MSCVINRADKNSDGIIDRLINRADKNSDGIITAQELANARLDGLASGIGGALSPMFDSIDTSLDGLINYDEFGKQFAGMASDAQLKRIFDQLDTNGDGTISRLESLKHSSDEVGDNTSPKGVRSPTPWWMSRPCSTWA
ncbi:EF-hand domain-containing protein [Halomonas elongata]|uniref:EF-hand domain-containing protein n=1 Tax=Halomonas elongata TaxID=2746 RepID=UPI002E2BDBBB|nr:EF-hand domain-containing protein [Halomonas elongata]WVI71415.1 EF-hand domain-containing protein [Halomonas elongata]